MSLLLVNANTLHIPLADKSVHMALTSPPYWGLRSYTGTANWEGGEAGCDHEAARKKTRFDYPIDEKQHSNTGSDLRIYGDLCPACGARRIDAQLGLERLHDCGAWSRREIVGFAEIDDWDEDEDAEGNRIFWVKGKKVTPVYGPPESPCGECFICHCRQWVAEVWRVLRDDGTFWLNIGDSYATGTTADRQDGTLNLGAGTNQARKIARNGTPPGLKPKDMCLIPQRLALALQADGWYVRSEIIWCLSHSTRVYAQTQKGEMPMTVGEMVRLKPETVNLWTGKKWARVGEFWQSPDTEGIEIALRSGQRVSCTPGHLWPTERGIVRADQLTLGDRLLSVQLPEPKEPKRPGGIPDRFGWVMGFYLAEGSTLKGDGLQFAMRSDENDEAERLHEFAEYYGSSFTLFDYGNKRNVHILGGAAGAIVHEYISNGDCKHKHLTTATWQRSNEFIHLLLLGYLAGDGYNDEKNNRWRLGFARNDALADDLRTIGARLDVSIRLKRTWNKNQTGKFYGWRGEVRFGSERRTSDTEIVGLQKSKSERFYDISIEDPHVFALSCGVLTHNSKPNPMPESVTDRPTKSHETVWLLAKSQHYFYDQDAVREPILEESQVRASYGYAPSGREINSIEAHHGKGYMRNNGESVSLNPAGRNRRDVWNIATESYSGAHFATWPRALVEPMIKAGTSEAGCCSKCGRQWERVVASESHYEKRQARDDPFRMPQVDSSGWRPPTKIDHGFRPSCACYPRADEWEEYPAFEDKNHPTAAELAEHERIRKLRAELLALFATYDSVPCTVLDPFAGSGTTLLVARKLGRKAIGLDLSYSYLHDQARARLSLDALDEWEHGKKDGKVLTDLPLFANQTEID